MLSCADWRQAENVFSSENTQCKSSKRDQCTHTIHASFSSASQMNGGLQRLPVYIFVCLWICNQRVASNELKERVSSLSMSISACILKSLTRTKTPTVCFGWYCTESVTCFSGCRCVSGESHATSAPASVGRGCKHRTHQSRIILFVATGLRWNR